MRVTVDPDQVKRVFRELRGSSAFQESRALAEAGRLPVEMLQAMSLRPEILKALRPRSHRRRRLPRRDSGAGARRRR